MKELVKMIALCDFPFIMANGHETEIKKGSEYEIIQDKVKFHEQSGRGEKLIKKGSK